MAAALPPPTWKAFAVFLIFPLHIVLGVLSVPVSLYLLLVVRSPSPGSVSRVLLCLSTYT